MKNTIFLMTLLMMPVSLLSKEENIAAQILLDSKGFQKLNIEPGDSLAVSPEGLIVIETKNNIYEFTKGTLLLKKPKKGIESFTFSGDGSFLTISSQKLGVYEKGKILEQIPLPAMDMKIVPCEDDELIYIYGQTQPKKWSVFQIRKGGNYTKVLSSDERITAVTDGNGETLIAFEDRIVSMKDGQKLTGVYKHPVRTDILSMAYIPNIDVLFFSTVDNVYMVREEKVGVLAAGVGGELQYQKDLHVLDPKRKLLLRFPQQALRTIQ